MNYEEALRYGETYLCKHEVAEADLNAWYLLEYVSGVNRTQYFVCKREQMDEEALTRYRELLEKRGMHIPLQYLTGQQEFMGLSFQVNEHVLIPRQDTEVLAEEALKKIHDGDRVLDMCTGSGCILISLMANRKIEGTGIDISEEALKVAKKNAAHNQVSPVFVKSDLFEAAEGMFDCIVSNPPYIRSSVIKELMSEVRDHEPLLALDGCEDGLYFYRKITEQAGGFLKENGWLLFEIGCDQGKDVAELMKKAGYKKIEIKKDLAGLDRVVLGQRKQEEKDV